MNERVRYEDHAGLILPTTDGAIWQARWRVEKYNGDWPYALRQLDPLGAKRALYDMIDGQGNLLMTLGALAMWRGLRGTPAIGFFNNANSFLGVGDTNTAAAAAQTDLQASLAANKAITSSTNASPISVLATGHGYTTGDTITITGHTTNTAANGTWVIIVVDANNFTLNGSTGNGVGGATGNAQKGNRMRVVSDATYPKIGTTDGLATDNLMQFQSTYGSGVAEFAGGWQEWATFNGNAGAASPANVMLNRKVVNLGTKGASTTWTLQTTLTLA